MTKKQIILCLLPIYKRVIQHIKSLNDFETAKNIIVVYRMEAGVCYASYQLLGQRLERKRWITRHITAPYVWANFPNEAKTIEEIASLLQIRVDIMEKELKRRWWHI